MVFDKISDQESAEFERFLDQLRPTGAAVRGSSEMIVSGQMPAFSGTVADVY